MSRFLPKTLRGQLVLMIFTTFFVVRLLDAAPDELRSAILKAANSPLVLFTLTPSASVTHEDHNAGGTVAARIRGVLEEGAEREIWVELHELNTDGSGMRRNLNIDLMHQSMMMANLSSVEMQLAIALKDGTWLNVSTRFHAPPVLWPWESILTFAIATLIIMLAVWIALNRLTGPIRIMAVAADKFGRGEAVSELPAKGPKELRRLTLAFNEMQARLTRSIGERTRILAALGHDLRSPLTAMRVRVEMVDDNETRERLVAIIAEMQEMVDSTLSFARGMVTSEESRNVDLAEFLVALKDEASDVGGMVSLRSEAGLNVRLKPVAMRGALRNVVENAIRYGSEAEIIAEKHRNTARIRVLDRGNGIPETELERVFDPFVRIEKSRNMETGGTGLGLSIARTIIHAHGGDITLSNRPEGGLQVEIILQLAKQDTAKTPNLPAPLTPKTRRIRSET